MKKNKFGQIFAYFVFIAVGACCGFFMAEQMFAPLKARSALYLKLLGIGFNFLLIYFAFMLGIIIHEGGHLIFGLLTGYKFCSFRVGSLMLVKKKEKLKLKRFSLMGTGGQCLLAPPDFSKKMPYKLYNLGGVIVNLICGGISAAIIAILNPSNSYLSLFLIGFTLINFANFLINGIPLTIGSIDNDGKNVFSLEKSESAKKAFWAQMKINALVTEEIRLRDMPEELFEVPEKNQMTDALTASMAVFACNREMDMMDFDKAKELADYALENAEGLIDLHKNILINELLYINSVQENQAEADKLMSDSFKTFTKAMAKNPSVCRSLYAYNLLIKNDSAEAEKQMSKFERIAKNYPHKCEVDGELELISYAKAKIK